MPRFLDYRLLAALPLVPFVAAQSENATRKELLRLEIQCRTPRLEGDITFLERFYAKDLLLQTADGAVIDRDTDIALHSHPVPHGAISAPRDVRITLQGRTAIITGLDLEKSQSVRFTDVLERQFGRWQLVAHQSTHAPQL